MVIRYYHTEIKYRKDFITHGTKLFKIGAFSVINPLEKRFVINNDYIVPDAARILESLLENEDMVWVIGESHGGLYLDIYTSREGNTLEVAQSIDMYVHITPEIYTFCKLKFAENLKRMLN